MKNSPYISAKFFDNTVSQGLKHRMVQERPLRGKFMFLSTLF